ncbi:thioredoxin-like protein [Cyathus striatus]|nr:thioredoxin-like protein [Cyathus striatus]
MYADIEALVLSGDFFNGGSRSSSPSRSATSDDDPGWHDDEIQLSPEEQKFRDLGYDSDSSEVARYRAQREEREREARVESIGMGPGRTGVKGVIRDRNEAADIQRGKKAKEMEELRKKMEESNLGGKTFLEEEREKAARGEKADELVTKERETAKNKEDLFGRKREGKFGHLREVGLKGFLNAVEKEEQGIWVVVHLYEPSLERCHQLDETLIRLARLSPDTKFLRARASALGFASAGSSSAPKVHVATRLSKAPVEDDEDDPYGYDDKYYDMEDEEDYVDDDDVDLDVLPTMLVYRGGELVHNWVRVDWEAGRGGVEELLDRHHILTRGNYAGSKGNLGLPSDDEDELDLLMSDDEAGGRQR